MMKNSLLPPNARLLATMHDPTPNEQLALRDNLIEKQEKEIAVLKELLRTAWRDLVQGDNVQMFAWVDRCNKVLGNGHHAPK